MAPSAAQWLRWGTATASRQVLLCALVILTFATVFTLYSTSTPQDLLLSAPPFKVDSAENQQKPEPQEARPSQKPDLHDPHPEFHPAHGSTDIPDGVRVVGLVFFGRRDVVRILDCYLKRNLKDHGGILDEVIFTVSTDDEDDLAYLEELLPTSPRYRKFVSSNETHESHYLAQWLPVNDPDAIYVKIDDDVVFIEDSTIPSVVSRLLENPRYFAVSANVINNPALSWVHYNMGVLLPYWPEMHRPNTSWATSVPLSGTWRASQLPTYNGSTGEPPEGFAIDGSTAPPYKGHRWLPVQFPDGQFYDQTIFPASTLTYDAYGPSLRNWAAVAQTHYSFLQHLEAGDMWRYKFAVWDYQYARLSINFFAVRGRDILDCYPFPILDDEKYLTTERPREVGRHVVVDGTGLAVHYAFRPQRDANNGHGITYTDVLSRYRAYAQEMVCPFPYREEKPNMTKPD